MKCCDDVFCCVELHCGVLCSVVLCRLLVVAIGQAICHRSFLVVLNLRLAYWIGGGGVFSVGNVESLKYVKRFC